MLKELIKKRAWPIYLVAVVVLTLVLGRVLLDKWLGAAYLLSCFGIGPPVLYHCIFKWNDDEQPKPDTPPRSYVALRILVMLFAAFFIVAGVMCLREDLLARKELDKQALPSLKSPADIVSPSPVQKSNGPKN